MPRRTHYANGDEVTLQVNGCDGCELKSVRGGGENAVIHERGCPHEWRDVSIECRDCGCDFLREERYQIVCPDCRSSPLEFECDHCGESFAPNSSRQVVCDSCVVTCDIDPFDPDAENDD